MTLPHQQAHHVVVLTGIPNMADQFTDAEDVWRLSDGARNARALLLTHPAGRELQLLINGDVEQRHVHEDFALLLDQAYTWKEAMIINGWK